MPRKLTIARRREMVAMLPRSRYLNGFASWPLSRPLMVRAAWMPVCMATSATPGRPFSAIMSPTANTSGCPGNEQSGCTAMRPARSHSAPDASASIRASGAAATPAAAAGQHPRQRRGRHARRPDRRPGDDPRGRPVGGAHLDARRVHVLDDRLGADLDPGALQLAGALLRQAVAEGGQNLLAAVAQDHPHVVRPEAGKAVADGSAAQLRDLP